MFSMRSSVRGAELVAADVSPSLLLNYTYCIRKKVVPSGTRITTEV
jgi:hypothetical protein